MMVKQLKLSHTFRSIKPHCNLNPNSEIKSTEISSPSRNQEWCVYLIASTNPPFKTYVGVTTDFSRRLKQHNGELRGGAKASRAGRPWLCACLVQGFSTHNLGGRQAMMLDIQYLALWSLWIGGCPFACRPLWSEDCSDRLNGAEAIGRDCGKICGHIQKEIQN